MALGSKKFSFLMERAYGCCVELKVESHFTSFKNGSSVYMTTKQKPVNQNEFLREISVLNEGKIESRSIFHRKRSLNGMKTEYFFVNGVTAIPALTERKKLT